MSKPNLFLRTLNWLWLGVDGFREKTIQAMGQYYEIVSIRQTEPPPDGKSSNWYRYVITFEGSISITG